MQKGYEACGRLDAAAHKADGGRAEDSIRPDYAVEKV